MQFHGTAVLERPILAQVSPVIGGPEWFDADEGSCTLRVHLPVTPALMVAALMPAVIDTDELAAAPDSELWGIIAAGIAADGQITAKRECAALEREEAAGLLDPGTAAHLALARRRVAGMVAR